MAWEAGVGISAEAMGDSIVEIMPILGTVARRARIVRRGGVVGRMDSIRVSVVKCNILERGVGVYRSWTREIFVIDF